MSKVLVWMMVMWSCISCMGLKEVLDPEKNSGEDVWTGPGVNKGDDGMEAVCYVTGIDYPSGWDWTDTAKDAEAARRSLVVLADGVPMLKLPIGEGHEVSADPDMHRVIDGHLYTIFCDETHTSIRKDGKAFLKYEGVENIRGIVVDEENFYTLGVLRNGGGFTYRKNGTLVLERRAGNVFERLHIDSGRVCFAFCQSVTTSEGSSERYYMVRDGRQSVMEFDEDVSIVWDMMSHQGKNCALVSSGPWNTLELIEGEEKHIVGIPHGGEMLSCRLFTSGKDICVEGLFSDKEGSLCSGIWIKDQEYMLFEAGRSVTAVCASDKDICCILNPDEDNPEGIIFKNGITTKMPEGYACRGENPLAVHNRKLHIALTSMTGGEPVLWKEGTVSPLKLNGPICTLSIDY